MGNSYSYLKIDIRRFSGKFIFQDGDIYRRITIAAGHPDNAFTSSQITTYSRYNSEGEWYYYNGDSTALYRVLNEFKPKSDNLTVLLNRLETDCCIQKYRNTWEVISDWVKWVKSQIPDQVISGVIIGAAKEAITWLFSSTPKLITAS